eukprot:1161623-Pelagomonas_calceolata.AAC.10
MMGWGSLKQVPIDPAFLWAAQPLLGAVLPNRAASFLSDLKGGVGAFWHSCVEALSDLRLIRPQVHYCLHFLSQDNYPVFICPCPVLFGSGRSCGVFPPFSMHYLRPCFDDTSKHIRVASFAHFKL